MIKAKIKIDKDTVFEREYKEGTIIKTVADEFKDYFKYDIMISVKNGKLMELTKELDEDCTLEFLDSNSPIGIECYRRTATLIMFKAFYKCVNRDDLQEISIQFSLSKGYYCKVKGNIKITDELLDEVEKEMKRLVDAKYPIQKHFLRIADASRKCAEYGMMDKVKLFKYRSSSTANLYELEGFEDYYFGYMLPDTSYIRYFKLYKYDEGFVIQLPTKEKPTEIMPFEPQHNVFEVLKESTYWGDMLDASTIGDLNEQIVSGRINDLILVQEAFQEKKIADIADMIADKKEVKFVMIAGPSSSGKTTFSHRLSIQLMARGLKPHPIPVDNYFVNREDNPKDENGDYDFEVLEALDIKLFNEHMTRLANGEEVELPEFNFKTGKREYKGNYLKLEKNEVLVIEGIHCLNSKMSYSIPEDKKFKIYISALTQLNVDEHNRIPTTDLRLIRRIVRDMRTRGSSAQQTISMWQSVRRGEENNIFPYQKDADAIFNSALIYELPVLKQYAIPALYSVPENTYEYFEANRLIKFLNYFLPVPGENVPINSLLREFIGSSVF